MSMEKSNRAGLRLEIPRRDLLRLGIAAGSGIPLSGLAMPASAHGAEQPAEPPLQPLNRFPRMVQEYFVRNVREAERRILSAQSDLRTKADAEAYVRDVRERIRRCFGPEPERTPLNARVTGVLDRDAYRVEKIIFESRPGFLVTANLYVPKGRKLPAPGVVGSCGHTDNGKAGDTYQAFSQGLARLGYVVLIFDPIGQGERLQYADSALKPRHGIGTSEHGYAGNQQVLVGEIFAAWRAWDGVRALDYLLSRQEVDRRHVGITGNSGGGTMTTWLCGLDRRWTMAAPGCFVTTFRRNLENELPADTEQCPPGVIAASLDHSDFLAAMAPKPVIILAKERDFFDVRGAIEAYERLKRIYRLLEAPDNIRLEIGPTEHGYSQEIREAMYRFFNGVTGISSATSEPPLTLEKDEALWCTPHGQVAELKSGTVPAFTRARSKSLAQARRTLSGVELKAAVEESLRIANRPAGAPEYRILRPLSNRGYPKPHASNYAVETEQGVFALAMRLGHKQHVSRPVGDSERALLYVSHHSADVELREEPFPRSLIEAEPTVPFYSCDVRGVGESRPGTCGYDARSDSFGSDYFYAAHSLMLDRPYLGQKTLDVLRVLDWLAAVGHRQVHLSAAGWGTLPAVFAALGNDLVVQVTLKGAPASYSAIAESEEYVWPLSTFIPGVLARFDLPECYQELRLTKQLRML